MVNQLKYVVTIMFALVLVYAGLWYTAAFEAEKDVAAKFADWRDRGLLVEHGKIQHGGFPYRITVTVEDLEFSTRRKGVELKADEFTLVTHLWTPGHWVAEAHGVQGAFADRSVSFTDDFLHGSYRQHENGKAVIVVNSNTVDDFKLTRLMGRDGLALTTWELAFMMDSPTEEAETGLYGARYLNFKVTGKTVNKQLEFTGGISGPIIKDWRSDDIAHWRDEGGLIEIDSIDYLAPASQVKGNASFTLDEDFRPLGSASLVRSGEADLKPVMEGLGFLSVHASTGNGPASLMLQNGRVSLNGEQVADLAQLLR